MQDIALIGELTPSSNTVLEPLTSAMLDGVPGVSAHFGRFRVTEISTRDTLNDQFRLEPQLAAAELLADARVDAIVWSGTSASWLGFDTDHAMCRAIEERTGCKAGTAVLAINDLFATVGARTYGLVSPYSASSRTRSSKTTPAAAWTALPSAIWVRRSTSTSPPSTRPPSRA